MSDKEKVSENMFLPPVIAESSSSRKVHDSAPLQGHPDWNMGKLPQKRPSGKLKLQYSNFLDGTSREPAEFENLITAKCGE